METLLAAREMLECDPSVSGVGSFNVYGFDLMVDEDMKVHRRPGLEGGGMLEGASGPARCSPAHAHTPAARCT